MKNETKAVLGIIGSFISAAGGLISAEDLDHIISAICSLGGFILTFTMVVIVPILHKVIEAKKDGKITLDEASDILDTTSNAIEEFKKETDNKGMEDK